MNKSYKTELRPNNKQTTMLKKHCGTARFAYNWMLGLLKEDYESNNSQLKPNAFQMHKLLNSKKKSEFPWMYEVSKCAPQFALRQCQDAYKRFFKKQSRFPRFKKKGCKDSYTVDGSSQISFTSASKVAAFVIMIPTFVINKINIIIKDKISLFLLLYIIITPGFLSIFI